MMGRVADLSDALRSTAPLLSWRDERLTRALLQLAVVSSFVLALAAPFIPWRLVFLVLGESAFLLSHPLAQSFLRDATERLQTPDARKKRQQATRRLLEDDALGDDELEGDVVEVQRLEVESRAPGASAAGAKEGEVWGNEAIVGGELPPGFRWLGEWEDTAPADGAVDAGASASLSSGPCPVRSRTDLAFSPSRSAARRRLDLHPPRRHPQLDAVRRAGRAGRQGRRRRLGSVAPQEAHEASDQEPASVACPLHLVQQCLLELSATVSAARGEHVEHE